MIATRSLESPVKPIDVDRWAVSDWSQLVVQEVNVVDGFLGFTRQVRYALAQLAAHRISESEAGSLRKELADRFEVAKVQLVRVETHRCAQQEQELMSRGLSNTTVLPSLRRAIEEGIQHDLAKLEAEYTFALEKIGFQQARRWNSWLIRWGQRFILFLDRPIRKSVLESIPSAQHRD